MNLDQPCSKKKSYSLKRAFQSVLGPSRKAEWFEADIDAKIRSEFGKFASPAPSGKLQGFMHEADRVMYVPFTSFGKAPKMRRDLGGGLFTTVSPISSKYTGGLCRHSAVFRLGATILENLSGQCVLTGTSAIPLPTFASASGTQQTLASSTLTAFSTSVTVSNTATLAVGMSVSGASVGYISPSTIVQQINDGTHITLSQPALQGGTVSLTFWPSADGTSQAINSPPVFIGGTVGSTSMFFNPLRMSFKVNVSKQLLRQAPEVFTPILRDQLARGLGSMLDNLALFGTGAANGQPEGVFSLVRPMNFGSTGMTWPNFQTYRQGVLASDLEPDSFGVIMSPAMLSYLDQTVAYGAGSSYSIYEKILDSHPDRVIVENSINTSTAMASTTTQSGTLTSGSANVTALTSTASLYVGQPLSGTGIQAGTTIAAITGATTITLSQTATATGAQTLTFTAAKGLFIGLWRFLHLMIWNSGAEVIFDEYSATDCNQTVVLCNILANCGTPWSSAFAALYQS